MAPERFIPKVQGVRQRGKGILGLSAEIELQFPLSVPKQELVVPTMQALLSDLGASYRSLSS